MSTRLLSRALQGIRPLLRLAGQGATPKDFDGEAPVATVLDVGPAAQAAQEFIIIVREAGVPTIGNGEWTLLQRISRNTLLVTPQVQQAFQERSWSPQDCQVFLLEVQPYFADGTPADFDGARCIVLPGDAGTGVQYQRIIVPTGIGPARFVWQSWDTLDPLDVVAGSPTDQPGIIMRSADYGGGAGLAARHQRRSSWLNGPVPITEVAMWAIDDATGGVTLETNFVFLVSPIGVRGMAGW